MFDAQRLLDQFLGGQLGTVRGRQPARGFDTSPLGNIARGLGAGGGGLGRGGRNGGLAAAGIAGLLMGGSGRRLRGSGTNLGGMAAIGLLAYNAYRQWKERQPVQAPAQPQANPRASMMQPPTGTPFNPTTKSEQQVLGRHMLRAMIATAKADGHLDVHEQENILVELDKLDLDQDDKAFVMEELRAPLDLDLVTRGVRSTEEASEIYTAALLAIDVDDPAERVFLERLATKLGLDPRLVEHLHNTVEVATVKV